MKKEPITLKVSFLRHLRYKIKGYLLKKRALWEIRNNK